MSKQPNKPQPVEPALRFSPIGYVKTPMRLKFDAPHQPAYDQPQENYIELVNGNNFEAALRDLDGFSHIWLVWWFHKNNSWRPMVRPPRGANQRRGVFATRSPHRPNPIGITAVKLLKVAGRKITIGACDLVDGTPILDIKPYLRTVDCFPEAELGWVAAIEEQIPGEQSYNISLSSLADEQLSYLKDTWQIDFWTRAHELLSKDPSVHRTRRISKKANGEFKMGCGAWRLHFTVTNRLVQILSISTGYPEKLLIDPGYDRVPDRDAQLEFNSRWRGS